MAGAGTGARRQPHAAARPRSRPANVRRENQCSIGMINWVRSADPGAERALRSLQFSICGPGPPSGSARLAPGWHAAGIAEPKRPGSINSRLDDRYSNVVPAALRIRTLRGHLRSRPPGEHRRDDKDEGWLRCGAFAGCAGCRRDQLPFHRPRGLRTQSHQPWLRSGMQHQPAGFKCGPDQRLLGLPSSATTQVRLAASRSK